MSGSVYRLQNGIIAPPSVSGRMEKANARRLHHIGNMITLPCLRLVGAPESHQSSQAPPQEPSTENLDHSTEYEEDPLPLTMDLLIHSDSDKSALTIQQ